MSEAPDRPASVLVAVSDAARAERVRAVIDALGMRAQVAASMGEAEGAAAPGRFDVAIVDGRLEAEGAAGLLRSVDPTVEVLALDDAPAGSHGSGPVRLARVPDERHERFEAALGAGVAGALERRRQVARLARHERLAAVGQLASGFIHQINTPLSYLLGNLSLVAETAADLEALARAASRLLEALDGADAAARGEPIDLARRREVVEAAAALREAWRARDLGARIAEHYGIVADALDGARAIGRIVGDLRGFAEVAPSDDVPAGPPPPAAVDLNAAVEVALRLTQPQARYHARVVRLLGEVPRIAADHGQVVQVAVALLSQAALRVRHAPEPAGGHQIAVRTADERGAAVLEVIDSGGSHAARAPSRAISLDLLAARDIARQTGGRIEMHREIARHVARVTWPAARQSSASLPAAKPATEPPPRRARLVVIDDDRHFLRVWERVFGPQHEVSVFTGAEEALAALRAAPDVDVIFCDVIMPGVSGGRLLDLLSLVDARLRDRVVFVTGGGHLPDVRALLARAGRPWLDKPVDFDEVARLVRLALAGSLAGAAPDAVAMPGGAPAGGPPPGAGAMPGGAAPGDAAGPHRARE